MSKTLLIILIVVLVVHYFLAIATIYVLLKDKGFESYLVTEEN